PRQGAECPGGAREPGRRLRPPTPRSGPDEGARDRGDARLGRRAAVDGCPPARAGARRRDARRRPQVRGGHPPGARRTDPAVPGGGSRARLTMTDPAIVRIPAGEAVDGRRLLAQSVAFGRALRGAGLGIDLGATLDFARALTLV